MHFRPGARGGSCSPSLGSVLVQQGRRVLWRCTCHHCCSQVVHVSTAPPLTLRRVQVIGPFAGKCIPWLTTSLGDESNEVRVEALRVRAFMATWLQRMLTVAVVTTHTLSSSYPQATASLLLSNEDAATDHAFRAIWPQMLKVRLHTDVASHGSCSPGSPVPRCSSVPSPKTTWRRVRHWLASSTYVGTAGGVRGSVGAADCDAVQIAHLKPTFLRGVVDDTVQHMLIIANHPDMDNE